MSASKMICIFLAVSLAFLPSIAPLPLSHDTATMKYKNSDEHGYQVILKSPMHFLKVEVVDDNGNATLQQLSVESEELSSSTTPPERDERPARRVRPKKRSHPNSQGDEERNYRCNWRRLYRLYLDRRHVQSRSYSKTKRNEIRKAFRIVCENPEDAIKILLDMDSVDD